MGIDAAVWCVPGTFGALQHLRCGLGRELPPSSPKASRGANIWDLTRKDGI